MDRSFSGGEPSTVITTRDGTCVRCQRVVFPLSPGSDAMSERRWVFSTPDGRQHVGPVAPPQSSEDDLELIVNEWWATRKAFLAARDDSGTSNP